MLAAVSFCISIVLNYNKIHKLPSCLILVELSFNNSSLIISCERLLLQEFSIILWLYSKTLVSSVDNLAYKYVIVYLFYCFKLGCKDDILISCKECRMKATTVLSSYPKTLHPLFHEFYHVDPMCSIS